jgi:pyridoxal phosphate enzyme (YggS family)
MAEYTKIKNNLDSIQGQLTAKCKLVIVSKFRTIDEIQCAYDIGHRTFAENRVQALLDRKAQLPDDIEWHLIGHLQRNKVKFIAPFIQMIHAVDSFKLLREINNQAAKHNRVIPCLIQVHIAQEESKFGLSPAALVAFFKNEEWHNLPNIQISGLMAMATLTDNSKQIEKEFNQVQQLFLDTKAQYNDQLPHFTELSIGMSSDYLLAQKYGSTMVRIGSAVFK